MAPLDERAITPFHWVANINTDVRLPVKGPFGCAAPSLARDIVRRRLGQSVFHGQNLMLACKGNEGVF
ncbi:hypothetical protein O3P69_016956 [Scylla paramamosain]|uniref:Uncharacterized protein n=1 Tax=Scylla paramamosain TaxID=85552 RepID=A0AAW0TUH9_SCYPA